MTGRPRHLLDIDDLGTAELHAVLDLAGVEHPPPVLAGHSVALLFEKPSLRTRVSMEVAVAQLGGHPVSLRDTEVGLGQREPVEDVGRVLSSYCSVVAARVFDHANLEMLASASSVPVVNLLSDLSHPSQILADLLTLRARFGGLEGLRVAWVGDGNNVCQSLLRAARLVGIQMAVATPSGYEPQVPPAAAGQVTLTADPSEAAAGAHAVYTDVWVSMGQEGDTGRRAADFSGFTVDDAIMSVARDDAVFLHCLPAHRGEEVAPTVIDGPASLVWTQAANRLHAQRGLLLWLMGTSQ